MKKYFLIFCLFTIALVSCRKVVNDTPFNPTAQALADDKEIQDYFLSNGITTAIKHSSGLYYQIINPGTGPHPTTASGVTVNYVGKFTSESEFDSQASYYFSPLSSLIEAWRIGIPLIGKGGTIILYVPSALGYGNTSSGKVPANTVTIFTITLQGFNN